MKGRDQPTGAGDTAPVLWTRGDGCVDLATLLSPVPPVRVTGDLTEACVRHRARLLVARRLPGHFDLASVAVPVDFRPDGVGSVVAAVAGGPHSALAAAVAHRLGAALGVKAALACAHRDDGDRMAAVTMIEQLVAEVPGIEYRLVEAPDAAGLVESLADDALLVIGAPGGNWFQRTVFGAGARLAHRATRGAVIVRSAPVRVFHVMSEPVFVGPLREAIDILRLHTEPLLAVVDESRLVGVVRREVLELADPGVPVADLMEAAVSVPLDALVEEAQVIRGRLGAPAIPVVDAGGRLVGTLAPVA